jgi:signal transduction histidine kinase
VVWEPAVGAPRQTSGLRALLLKSLAASALTLAIVWDLDPPGYPSDRDYWAVEADAMCQSLARVRPDAVALAAMPVASPVPDDAWTLDCGDGLVVRAGRHDHAEAIAVDAAGVARQVAAATLVWPDETIGDLVYRFIALCVSGLLALVVIVPLVRRAREIESVALAVAAGNLDARARPGGPRELASLSRAIHTMADRVAALLRSRQVMLRAVAHEVAQPLTRMRFTLELLRDTDDADRRERQVARLDQDIGRLEQLAEAVTAQLRRESAVQEAPRGSVALAPVVRQLVAELDPGGSRVDVVAGDVRAVVAPELFRIAARNLVENALRHAEQRVAITLTAEALTVDDDGPGVPAGDRERVLRPFEQAGHAGAMGLGLPIAADVARVFGGELSIDDGPLGGARLVLPLPL